MQYKYSIIISGQIHIYKVSIYGKYFPKYYPAQTHTHINDEIDNSYNTLGEIHHFKQIKYLQKQNPAT